MREEVYIAGKWADMMAGGSRMGPADIQEERRKEMGG